MTPRRPSFELSLGSRPFRPVAWLTAVVTGLWVGLMLAATMNWLESAAATTTFRYAHVVAGFVVTGVCCWSWARAHARQRGWAHGWRLLMGGGLLAWTLGQLRLATTPPQAASPEPIFSAVHFGNIALLLLALVALAAFPAATNAPSKSLAEQGAHTPTRRSRAVVMVDAVAIVLALLGLAWATVLGDQFQTTLAAEPEWIYSLTCLILDLILVTQLLLINMLGRPFNPQALAILSLGLAVISISDLLSFFSLSTGFMIVPGLSEIGSLLGPIFLGLAVIVAEVVPDARPVPGDDIATLATMPYWPLGAVVILVLTQQISRTGIDPIEVQGLILLVFLLILRQILTSGENFALIRSVRESQVRLQDKAFHDPLTRLPNRAVFQERLSLAAKQHCQESQSLAVYFCDVDGLKPVNDGLGHSAGDFLLKIVARRLSACVRPQDTVARLGGDEFGIIVSGYSDDPEVIGKKILEAVKEPTVLADQFYRPTVSLGLVVSDPSEENITAESLTNRADAAMYAAKRAGKGGLVVFRDGLESGTVVLGLTAQLRLAIGRENTDPRAIGMAYQPIMRLSDGAVLAVEALARWRHPTRGPISPCNLIRAAEYGGMLFALDETVLDIACRDLRFVRDRTGVDLELHVNLTAASVTDPRLCAAVARTLEHHGIPPSALILEITDTARITDLEVAAAMCAAVKQLGVRWALDDLGAGQGSLEHLLRLPINTVKLDRKLLSGTVDPAKCLAIGSGAVHMTEKLGMSLIASGIERPDQLAWLSRLGCQFGQGNLLAPPLAVMDLVEHHGLAVSLS